ncbi:hypothetical protein HYS10_01975 [Candidatus Collierbacteria bacterium]|nr:hypothetical protein [Candidatus Collierbacteria bacterium]
MKHVLLGFLFFFLLAAHPALAIYDPLSVKNNKIGVHVLSPDELEQAAKLVNNDDKSEWGYITVPIQATDRDREKWTRFMKNAAKYKVIPIVRVATFVDGPLWLKPGDSDLIDFANFLNDLPWPIENRYVIIFNEVNRADEFGGVVNPEKYADILSNAIDIFKNRSDKFFILPAGLDNAAPNRDGYMRWDIYLTQMYQHNPEIFNRLDGWTSHAYGNPDFAADPLKSGQNKADSYKYDFKLLNQFTKKKLPVFITEAGWSSQRLNAQSISNFYNYAFTHIWSNDQVVAVTPFLLFADNGPFTQFSLLNKDRVPTLAYQTIQKFSLNGQPRIEDYSPKHVIAKATVSAVLSAETTARPSLIRRLITFIKNLFQKNSFNLKVNQLMTSKLG